MKGNAITAIKTKSPAIIFPPLYISAYLLVAFFPGKGFKPYIKSPLFFALHDHCIGDKLVCPCHTYTGHPIVHGSRKGSPVDRADVCQHIHSIFIMYMFHRVCPRKSAPHTQFHILRGVQPGAASTAEG